MTILKKTVFGEEASARSPPPSDALFEIAELLVVEILIGSGKTTALLCEDPGDCGMYCVSRARRGHRPRLAVGRRCLTASHLEPPPPPPTSTRLRFSILITTSSRVRYPNTSSPHLAAVFSRTLLLSCERFERFGRWEGRCRHKQTPILRTKEGDGVVHGNHLALQSRLKHSSPSLCI